MFMVIVLIINQSEVPEEEFPLFIKTLKETSGITIRSLARRLAFVMLDDERRSCKMTRARLLA